MPPACSAPTVRVLMHCASFVWKPLVRTEGGDDASAQIIDLPEDAVDYIIAASLDCCRDISPVSGGDSPRIRVQVKGAEPDAGAQAVAIALRRAAFSPSTSDNAAALDGDGRSPQASGWRVVTMQRGLL